MTGTSARFVRVGTIVLGLMAMGWFLTGHAAESVQGGLATDWSHQHLIFSQPRTAQQAQRVMSDLRYWQQWYRLHARSAWKTNSANSPAENATIRRWVAHPAQSDWQESLGSGATTGAGNFPAKYTFLTNNVNCDYNATPDYVVFSTGLEGSGTQASVVAYDNLYSGCGGTVPQTYWAYNTGGQILTSPTISDDGTQVAFVQTSAALEGVLVVLKWSASTSESVGSPMTLTAVSPSAYRSCTAPCMTTINLQTSGGTDIDDRTSSGFVAYTADTLWVGGALGWLHKITGVFRGTPAEVKTGGFPVQVQPGNPTSLSSPVYDYNSTNVFVGDYGGYFYRVNSSTGAVTKSLQVDFGTGIVAGPLVDSTSELVYVFVSSDGTTTTACSDGPCSAVIQFKSTFAANTKGTTKVQVGSSSATPNPLYEGAVDNAYLTSGTATGNLYVCGNTGAAPTLYEIPVSAGTLEAPVAGPTLSGAVTPCSPVTDVANPNISSTATEWIFASAEASGTGNSCASGGCVMNFVDDEWQPSTTYSLGQEVIDTHFQIQVVRVAGKSGTTHPTWSTTVGGTAPDGTVSWLNQGPQIAAHASWAPSTPYVVHDEIVDSNGNIQDIVTGGTSGTTQPNWSKTVSTGTSDNHMLWLNVGSLATVSQASAGGTSGIIMDNVIPSTQMAGASQVYYSTQSNQTCGTSGTGGCAVQASQSALQ